MRGVLGDRGQRPDQQQKERKQTHLENTHKTPVVILVDLYTYCNIILRLMPINAQQKLMIFF